MPTRYSSPAFPAAGASGLSKREYMAAQVLASLALNAPLAQAVQRLNGPPENNVHVKRLANGLSDVALMLADALLKKLGSDQVDGDGSPPWHDEPSTNGRHVARADETVSFDPPPATDQGGSDESGVDLGNIPEGNP